MKNTAQFLNPSKGPTLLNIKMIEQQGKMINVNRMHLGQSNNWLDEYTYESIISEFYPRIYEVVFRLVGDRDDADDLAAETFWRLWNHPPARNENLAGWLFRVGTRLGYNALRSAHRRINYETKSDDFKINHMPNPALEVEKRSEQERVRQILCKMHERDVQILTLRYSGLSYKEIALAVNVSPASVGSLLSRAEEKFETLYMEGE